MIRVIGTQNEDLIYSGWISISEFEQKFLSGKILRYDKFNRKKVWKDVDVDALETSIYKGDLYNPMVLVPIQESIELAIERGDKKDEQFFTDASNNGEFAFLTLIGGNRGEAIEMILTRNDDIHNASFKIQLVPLILTRGLSRLDIHRKFGADLRGVVPNAQEGRNSIWTGDNCDSEWVRKISVKYSDLILSKSGLNRDTQRMLDDEFVASLLSFTRYRVFGSGTGYATYDETLDAIYEEGSTRTERKLTTELLGWIERCWKEMPETRKPKSYWYSIQTLGGIVQDETLKWFGRKSPKEFVDEFDAWWLKRMADDNTMYQPAGKNITWNTMVGGFRRDTHIKVLKFELRKFINEMTQKQVLKIDRSEDLATPEQRTKIESRDLDGTYVLVRQNGSIEGEMFDENLPEFIRVPLSEVQSDKNLYPSDHILPKDDGGEHEVENLEITTQAYNSWKRKRLPDYKLLSKEEKLQQS